MKHKLFLAVTLVAMAFVASAQNSGNANPTSEQRIARLEQQVSALQQRVEQQSEQISVLQQKVAIFEQLSSTDNGGFKIADPDFGFETHGLPKPPQ